MICIVFSLRKVCNQNVISVTMATFCCFILCVVFSASGVNKIILLPLHNLSLPPSDTWGRSIQLGDVGDGREVGVEVMSLNLVHLDVST